MHCGNVQVRRGQVDGIVGWLVGMGVLRYKHLQLSRNNFFHCSLLLLPREAAQAPGRILLVRSLYLCEPILLGDCVVGTIFFTPTC